MSLRDQLVEITKRKSVPQMRAGLDALLDRPVKPGGIVVEIKGKTYHVPNRKAAEALRRRLG